MTLQQLRYFLAACSHGSFAGAAEALHIAQPSLAEQVRRLEQELGTRLFIRTGRRIELTEAGTKLRHGAERVLTEVDASLAAVRETVGLRRGTASIGTFGLAHRYLIADVARAFVDRYPEVNLRVVGQHSREVIEKVRDGELEAGIVSLPVEHPSLHVEALGADEILFVDLPGPDTRGPMPIEGLARVRLIAYTATLGWQDSIRRQLAAQAGALGTTLTAAIEVEHLESALELAGQGLGATYVPKAIAARVLDARLVAVPFAPRVFDTYAVIRRRDHQLSPATSALISLVRRQLEASGGLRPAG